MARHTFGAFKKTYKGYGIYFADGRFNAEGTGEYPSIKAAEAAIDRFVATEAQRCALDATNNAASGEYLVAHKHEDGTVTVDVPGVTTLYYGSVTEAQRAVFSLQDRYDKELIWI